ncbi:MAG: hypothetical protein ACK506_18075, partial [Pirellula sp.]
QHRQRYSVDHGHGGQRRADIPDGRREYYDWNWDRCGPGTQPDSPTGWQDSGRGICHDRN